MSPLVAPCRSNPPAGAPLAAPTVARVVPKPAATTVSAATPSPAACPAVLRPILRIDDEPFPEISNRTWAHGGTGFLPGGLRRLTPARGQVRATAQPCR